MSDRLAEIEARVERWEVKGTVEGDIDGEPWGVEGVVGIAVTMRESDYDWLIARIRKLEAQAAADATAKEVADAALAFDLADKLTDGYRKDYGYNRDRAGYSAACMEWVTAKWRLRDALAKYDAALAARKEE